MDEMITATPWVATHNASLVGDGVIPLMATQHTTVIGTRRTSHMLFELGEAEPSWAMFDDGSITRLRETVGGQAVPIHAESHGVIVKREDRHQPIGSVK